MALGYVVFRARAGMRYHFNVQEISHDTVVFTVTDDRGRLVADRRVDSTIYVPEYEPEYARARGLYDAAARGDVRLVHRLLGEGAELDWAGPVGTPLIVAAMRGHLEVVRALIEEGANVNAVSPSLWSALGYAADRGHVEVLRMLLAHGAWPELNQPGWYPLHLAAARGDTPAVNALLAHGALAWLPDHAGRLAWEVAEKAGHHALAERLRQAARRVDRLED
ncbi:MAG: ankyrin repeat domain-containing protein [Mariprofundaceae bacterium]